ncbi:MAG: GNAT family N-acetyltransferase [Oscillospiraceae bacterium]|nr:GNAT family N-acetyltransferase [Oscillospiraceae bacterium]
MHCELRKWRLSDAADLAAALSNKEILNNLRDGLPYPYTEQDAAAYITAMHSADENSTFAYAITVEGKVVGSIGAFRQGNIHARTAELGYYLARDYWGRGIMTDAIRRLCALIFDTTDILRIYAEPFAYNAGSCRALEKAGFAYEGTMKNSAVKNGKVVDMRLYALTRPIAPYPVRRLCPWELPGAVELVWQVFCRFESPEYGPEGTAEFRRILDDASFLRSLTFYGAFDGEDLVGVLAMRPIRRISLFFVREDHHRRGIGRALFDAMRRDYDPQVFTANASPYASEVYRRLGFAPTAGEQVTSGIRYTPMEFTEKGET